MNINEEKTVLCSIVKNVSIQIDSMCVVQSLLIIKKASQLMILDMLYASTTFMIIRVYSNDMVNIEIMSLKNNKKI